MESTGQVVALFFEKRRRELAEIGVTVYESRGQTVFPAGDGYCIYFMPTPKELQQASVLAGVK